MLQRAQRSEGRRGGERRADGQPEPGWSGATLNRECYCSCSLTLKASETHRPYPAWSLRSGPRSGRLTKQMHFVCEPTPGFLASQFTPLAAYLYGYAAAKLSVEIARFMPLHPMQDEKFAAVFEHAAESIIGSFANNFTRRLRFSQAETDYGREPHYKIMKPRKLRPGIFG